MIYYHFVEATRIALLLAYPKNTQDDLSPTQKKILMRIIETWR